MAPDRKFSGWMLPALAHWRVAAASAEARRTFWRARAVRWMPGHTRGVPGACIAPVGTQPRGRKCQDETVETLFPAAQHGHWGVGIADVHHAAIVGCVDMALDVAMPVGADGRSVRGGRDYMVGYVFVSVSVTVPTGIFAIDPGMRATFAVIRMRCGAIRVRRHLHMVVSRFQTLHHGRGALKRQYQHQQHAGPALGGRGHDWMRDSALPPASSELTRSRVAGDQLDTLSPHEVVALPPKNAFVRWHCQIRSRMIHGCMDRPMRVTIAASSVARRESTG